MTRPLCFGSLIWLMAMMLTPVVYAQQADGVAQPGSKKNSDLSKYRFLRPLEREGAFAPELEQLPEETAADFETRKNIRVVLSLVGGDSVRLPSGKYVKFVQVPENESGKLKTGPINELMVAKARNWISKFMEDPDLAIQNYDGINLHTRTKDEDGAVNVHYQIFFSKEVIQAIRGDQIQRYDALMEKRANALMQKGIGVRQPVMGAAGVETPAVSSKSARAGRNEISETVLRSGKAGVAAAGNAVMSGQSAQGKTSRDETPAASDETPVAKPQQDGEDATQFYYRDGKYGNVKFFTGT